LGRSWREGTVLVALGLTGGGGCGWSSTTEPAASTQAPVATEDASPAAAPAPEDPSPWPMDRFTDVAAQWDDYRAGGEAHRQRMAAGREALASFGEVPGEGVLITYSKVKWSALDNEGKAVRALRPLVTHLRGIDDPPPRRTPRVLREVNGRTLVHYAHQSPDEGWLNPTPIGLEGLLDALKGEGGLPLAPLETSKRWLRWPDGHTMPYHPDMAWLCPQFLGWRDAEQGMTLVVCGEEGQPVVYPTDDGGLFLPFARLDASTRAWPEPPREFIGLAVALRRP